MGCQLTPGTQTRMALLRDRLLCTKKVIDKPEQGLKFLDDVVQNPAVYDAMASQREEFGKTRDHIKALR